MPNSCVDCAKVHVPLCVECSMKGIDDIVLCLKCNTGQDGPLCVRCSKVCPDSKMDCIYCKKHYCSFQCYEKHDSCRECDYCKRSYVSVCQKCGFKSCVNHEFVKHDCVEVCNLCDTDPVVCEFSPQCYSKVLCACRKSQLNLSIHVCRKHENFMTPYSCMVCRERYRTTERRYIKDSNACLDCYKKVQFVVDRMILSGFPRDVINLVLLYF